MKKIPFMHSNEGPTSLGYSTPFDTKEVTRGDTSVCKESVSSTDLPDHLLVDILGEFLHGQVKTFCSASQTCKAWSLAIANEPFWEMCLISRFGPDARIYHSGCFDEDLSPLQNTCRSRRVYAATQRLERRFSAGDFLKRSRERFDASLTDVLISGDNIYIGDNKGRIHVHGAAERQHWLNTDSGVSCLALSSCSNILFSGHADGSVNLWQSGDEPTPIAVHEANSRINAIACPDEHLFASTSVTDMALRVVDIATQQETFMRRFSPERAPNAVACSSPNLILVGSRDNAARIVDLRSADREVLRMDLRDWCLCVEWSSEFTVRASDKAVKVFDLRRPQEPSVLQHMSKRLITKFKSDGILRLVSCGLDGQVNVSALGSSDQVPVTMQSDDDYILSVDFSRTTLCFGGINGLFQSLHF